MIEVYVCYNLFFFLFIFNKNILKGNLKGQSFGKQFTDFFRTFIEFTGIKIVYSFLKICCYNIYMVHVSLGKERSHTDFSFVFNPLSVLNGLL